MDKPNDSTQPEVASSPVDPSVPPQHAGGAAAGPVPLSYMTPGTGAQGNPPSVLARTVACIVGFCGGVILVAFSGFLVGLFFFESRQTQIVPGMFYYIVFVAIAVAVNSFRRPTILLTGTRWFTLGLLLGGGLTCLVEGTCFVAFKM